MANRMIDDLSSLINSHIGEQETLLDYIIKIEAIVDVTLCEGFLSCTDETIHYYLKSLNDLVTFTKRQCEQSLNKLIELSTSG